MDQNSNNYTGVPEPAPLNLMAVIGFNGTVIDGLILHPDNETLIFPIGSQIVVRNVLNRQDRFLKVKIKKNNIKKLFINRVIQMMFQL